MKKTNVQRKAMKIKPFTEVKKHWGLCSCCNYSPTCTYPRESGRSVLQCDEFDGISSPPEQRIKKIRNLSINYFSGTHPDAQGPVMSTGLCPYCENFHACTYPKPEGGVWHCEEYR